MKDNPMKPISPQKIILSAVAGLGLFWVVESAVCRRIGFDLLLPFDGGRFLPVRLAVLCAALALCLCLGLTARGGKLLSAFNAACEKDWVRWLAALTVTGLFFLWTLRVTVLSYMTNDDVFFMQAISNIPAEGIAAVQNTLAHSAQESTSSISVLLCAIIGFFYGFDPEGYWYLGYHLVMLLVSLTVIGRCVLLKTGLRGWPAWVGCAIHALLCAGVFMYAFAELAFTVTSAVVGSAAVALVLCRHHEKKKSGRVFSDIFAAALLILCCLQRRATGYSLLCFWALGSVYQVIKIWQKERTGLKQRLSAFGLYCALCLALVGGVYAAGRLESDSRYQEAEHYRSLIVDFLNDEVTYDEYARAGVSQELAILIHGWFFMDEKVTTDLFRSVADIYYADQQSLPSPSLPARVLAMVSDLLSQVRSNPQMLWRTLCAGALALACAAGFILYGRRYWLEGLCALCAVGGALVLLLYLVKDGRFLTRAFLVVALPAIVTLLLAALSAPGEPLEVSPGRRAASGLIAAFSALALVLSCFMGVRSVPHAADTATREDVFGTQWAIEDYARAHPDITLLTSIYDIIFDPVHTPSEYPENRVLWGACGDTAKDPKERLYADAFFRDDVQFMTDLPTTVVYLNQYLTLDYGPVQALTAANLADGITVFDLSRVTPDAPDYTGWYEQNGMTYYFQNGEAVTGTKTIDGVEYEFAPAGAAAQLVVTPNAGSAIYTTNAYSLVSTQEAS